LAVQEAAEFGVADLDLDVIPTLEFDTARPIHARGPPPFLVVFVRQLVPLVPVAPQVELVVCPRSLEMEGGAEALGSPRRLGLELQVVARPRGIAEDDPRHPPGELILDQLVAVDLPIPREDRGLAIGNGTRWGSRWRGRCGRARGSEAFASDPDLR